MDKILEASKQHY